jgi:serine/threonine-protein kinase PBS1
VVNAYVSAGADEAGGKGSADAKDISVLKRIPTQAFTFRELAAVTTNFRNEGFIGEGGFGRVYKGRLVGTGQVTLVFLNTVGGGGLRVFLFLAVGVVQELRLCMF